MIHPRPAPARTIAARTSSALSRLLEELLTSTLSTFWIGARVLHAVSAAAATSAASPLETRTMGPPVVVARMIVELDRIATGRQRRSETKSTASAGLRSG